MHPLRSRSAQTSVAAKSDDRSTKRCRRDIHRALKRDEHGHNTRHPRSLLQRTEPLADVVRGTDPRLHSRHPARLEACRSPDWAGRIRHEITRHPGDIFLVAHSFGALAGAQAAADYRERIRGALLVAPADPEKFGISDQIPAEPLGFPSVVIASANDPWISLARASKLAASWGAEFVNVGNAGHINVEAGFGAWPEGLAIFNRLRRTAALEREAARSDADQPPQPRTRSARGWHDATNRVAAFR